MLYFCRNRCGCVVRRDLGTHSDDHRRYLLVVGYRLNHRALFGRVVHQRPHAAEDRREHREADRRVALGSRNEDRLTRYRAHRVIRVVVAVAEDDAVVVLRRVPREVADQVRTVRTFGIQPPQLVVQRVLPPEDGIRSTAEHERITLLSHTKAPDLHAVHGLDARWQLVLPRNVVAGAGGQDLDVAWRDNRSATYRACSSAPPLIACP